MAVLKRELNKSARGPVANDEDWWRLVYDTENKRLYVEHEWAHLDVRRRGAANSGTEQIEIAAYLAGPGVGPCSKLRTLRNPRDFRVAAIPLRT
jgi:hypothetical protein